jgi:hypothetical protein
MIVAVGLDVDDTFAHFVEQALEANVPLQVVNLRAAVEGSWAFEIPARSPARLRFGGISLELRPDDSYFCRMIDLSSQEADPELARRWPALLGAFRAWLDGVPGRVVNRGEGANHNSSKPLHEAVLGELGFRVPESLTSCDAEELRRFAREGLTVSKTVCGVRAEAVAVTEKEFENFQPASGPVHIQRLIAGADARIHVVGDQLIAQRVTCGGIDYRRSGGMDHLELFDPPPSLRRLLVEGGKRTGLAFSGWDFKIDADKRYWCLEVNPMPGYSSYDERCGCAISRELLRYLGAGQAQA